MKQMLTISAGWSILNAIIMSACLMLAISCGQQDQSADSGHGHHDHAEHDHSGQNHADHEGHDHGAHEDAVHEEPGKSPGVTWKNLNRLDQLSEQGLQFAADRVEMLLEIIPEMKSAAQVVAGDDLPAGVQDPGRTRGIQQQLAALASTVPDPDLALPEELIDVVEQIHETVLELMKAAGVPHVHGAI
jgi:ABC-type Zn2+ transport system substrate-binding protein/surface adhesin